MPFLPNLNVADMIRCIKRMFDCYHTRTTSSVCSSNGFDIFLGWEVLSTLFSVQHEYIVQLIWTYLLKWFVVQFKSVLHCTVKSSLDASDNNYVSESAFVRSQPTTMSHKMFDMNSLSARISPRTCCWLRTAHWRARQCPPPGLSESKRSLSAGLGLRQLHLPENN